MDLKRLKILTERLITYEAFLSIKVCDAVQAHRNLAIELDKPRIIAFSMHPKSEYESDIKKALFDVDWAKSRIRMVINELNKIK